MEGQDVVEELGFETICGDMKPGFQSTMFRSNIMYISKFELISTKF